MRTARKLWIVALLFLPGCLAGCKTAEQNDNTLAFLERGKATGHLVVTTDGRVGGSLENSFSFGAGKSNVAFDGKIDFDQPLLREVVPPAEPSP